MGLITYMRTDAPCGSPTEAQAAARSFVTGRYGAVLTVPPPPGSIRTKAVGAGRPRGHPPQRTWNLTPERVKERSTSEQYRLYRLIWSRFLASQMSNAVYDSVSVELGPETHSFRASASSLKFAGYTAVYEGAGTTRRRKRPPPLPPLAQGEVVTLTGI